MTDQPANPDENSHTMSSGWTAEPLSEPGEERSTGRAILLAFAFAAFAAWVAADFATGGKLTAWAVGTLAGLRRGGQPE